MAERRTQRRPPLERDRRRAERAQSRSGSTYKRFLKDLVAASSMTEELAERAASSVLCCLERRLISGEARDLEAQLPKKLQALLVRCERHTGLPPTKFGLAELLRTVSDDLGVDRVQAEAAARAVCKVVADHVSVGELEEVVHQLPKDIRGLFPSLEDYAVKASAEAARGRAATPRRKPASKPGGPSAKRTVRDILGLPVDAQLGVLRTLAPKILTKLDRADRRSFLRDLEGEIVRVERGEPSYEIH